MDFAWDRVQGAGETQTKVARASPVPPVHTVSSRARLSLLSRRGMLSRLTEKDKPHVEPREPRSDGWALT